MEKLDDVEPEIGNKSTEGGRALSSYILVRVLAYIGLVQHSVVHLSVVCQDVMGFYSYKANQLRGFVEIETRMNIRENPENVSTGAAPRFKTLTILGGGEGDFGGDAGAALDDEGLPAAPWFAPALSSLEAASSTF